MEKKNQKKKKMKIKYICTNIHLFQFGPQLVAAHLMAVALFKTNMGRNKNSTALCVIVLIILLLHFFSSGEKIM